jgi:hypothetical protein
MGQRVRGRHSADPRGAGDGCPADPRGAGDGCPVRVAPGRVLFTGQSLACGEYGFDFSTFLLLDKSSCWDRPLLHPRSPLCSLSLPTFSALWSVVRESTVLLKRRSSIQRNHRRKTVTLHYKRQLGELWESGCVWLW